VLVIASASASRKNGESIAKQVQMRCRMKRQCYFKTMANTLQNSGK
jgi:hypothetical protein